MWPGVQQADGVFARTGGHGLSPHPVHGGERREVHLQVRSAEHGAERQEVSERQLAFHLQVSTAGHDGKRREFTCCTVQVSTAGHGGERQVVVHT